jgi:hypothetical protein
MQTALEKWGLNAQCDQTVEECAELIVVLQKYLKRSPKAASIEQVIDEIADVEMMLAQIRLALGIDDKTLREQIERKLEIMRHYMSSQS